MVDPRYNKSLSKLFNGPVIRELASVGESSFFSSITEQSGIICEIDNHLTYRLFYELLYDYFLKNYRCEYVYKNAIANKILLGRHSLNTSALLTEFRSGSAKADLVLLNGTSTVYEVKTELDTLDRLKKQIESYRDLFEYIYVITHESQMGSVLDTIEPDIGLILLTHDYTLREIKNAESNLHHIRLEKLFDSLRINEYCQVLKEVFGTIPKVPNTKIYAEAKKIFKKIRVERAHKQSIKVLRRRNPSQILQSLIPDIPHCLKMTSISTNLTNKQAERFQQVLNKRLYPKNLND